MLLTSSLVNTQSVVDWVQDRSLVAEASDSLIDQYCPLRIPASFGVAITAALESFLVALDALVILGVASVKDVLIRMKFEELAKKISDKFTFAAAWSSVGRSGYLASYVGLGFGAMLISPSLGVRTYYGLLPANEVEKESVAPLKDGNEFVNLTKRFFVSLVHLSNQTYRFVQAHPILVGTGILIASTAMSIDRKQFRDLTGLSVLDDLHASFQETVTKMQSRILGLFTFTKPPEPQSQIRSLFELGRDIPWTNLYYAPLASISLAASWTVSRLWGFVPNTSMRTMQLGVTGLLAYGAWRQRDLIARVIWHRLV